MGFVNVVNELICNQTMSYLRCKSGRYIPLLKLKRNWSMVELWSDLIYKCVNDMELHSWDELINDLAEATDTFIRKNGDQWIKFIAEYNFLFLKLFKRNLQFYP
uniref:Uncharacterized protein n=1 Tax=Onchocerca volvulus TaxID=6282 RepID=A0A8R1XZM7_ONCVO